MEVKVFEALDDITPDVVDWLLDGTEAYPGGYRATRYVCYKTRRGATRRACALVNPETGKADWSSTNGRGGWKRLTAEERRIFEPQVAAEAAEAKAAAKRAQAEREAANRAAAKPVSVGDVFAGSYGYEAFLTEFYEVVALEQSGRVARIRRIADKRDRSGYGYDEWMSQAVPGEYIGRETRHVVKWDAEDPSIRIASFLTVTRIDPARWFRNYSYH